MKSPFLFGVETEYAIGGARRGNALPELLRQAQSRIPHIPSAKRRDLFLQNGSRLYVDTGGHPELATPECTSPSELVRYVLAGESLLVKLLDSMDRSRSGSIYLYKGNVDYSGAKTTWGCHESYLHGADLARLPDQLIPHLVSRIVYTGAGGFNPLSPGIEFSLSPRVAHLQRVISTDSTYNRGIFHAKNESLSSTRQHRLHILCGESLCSHLAGWLKVGTTALVVAMIEGGRHPGKGLAPTHPLAAMKAFAADPDCRETVPVESGSMTAVAIQRRYLEAAEDCLGAKLFPDWAEEICQEWRRVLDRLESDPAQLGTSLDWAMKRALYTRRLERRGLTWSAIAHTTGVLASWHRTLDPRDPACIQAWESIFQCPQPDVHSEWQRLASVANFPLGREELKEFLDLRSELYETEIRFGQLGPEGLFARLEREGVLSHSAPGVIDVSRALTEPPAMGRARIRGETIREFGATGEFRAEWMTIFDLSRQRILDLSNPFASEASWRTCSESEWATIRQRFELMSAL